MDVKSAARVLDIFELLAGRTEGLTVTEIGTHLGFPLSSTHALLKTLVNRGYLVMDPASRAYRLGARLFEVGNRYLEHLSVVDVAREPMRLMRELCDETISLGVFDGDRIVLVRKNESSRALRIGNPLGTRLPVHASAMGKAILAAWPEAEVLAFLKDEVLEAATPHTQTSRSSLLSILEEVRETGVAYDREESTEGVYAVAASLAEGKGRATASLAIVVPSVRARGAAWDRLPELLLVGAKAIGDLLQGQQSGSTSVDLSALERAWRPGDPVASGPG